MGARQRMTARESRRARRALRTARHAQALVPAGRILPATPTLPVDAPGGSVLTPELVVQVVRIEQQVRWQRRRDLVSVVLPRAVLGQRVADGLRAVPFRYGLLAFAGLLVLRDVGVHGPVAVTLGGVVMGAGIGVALMKGTAGGGACADDVREQTGGQR